MKVTVDTLAGAAIADRLAMLARVRESHADPAPYPPIVIGARVKYTREFLKSILEPPNGRLWRLELTVIDVGPRWLTIVREGERDAMLVKPAAVQRIEIPTIQTSSAAENGYAVAFGFEPQLTPKHAEELRMMGDLRSRGRLMAWENLAEDILGDFASHAGRMHDREFDLAMRRCDHRNEVIQRYRDKLRADPHRLEHHRQVRRRSSKAEYERIRGDRERWAKRLERQRQAYYRLNQGDRRRDAKRVYYSQWWERKTRDRQWAEERRRKQREAKRARSRQVKS